MSSPTNSGGAIKYFAVFPVGEIWGVIMEDQFRQIFAGVGRQISPPGHVFIPASWLWRFWSRDSSTISSMDSFSMDHPGSCNYTFSRAARGGSALQQFSHIHDHLGKGLRPGLIAGAQNRS